MSQIRIRFQAYWAFAAMTPKLFLAYRIWVWMDFFVQILAMTIFVYFWRAVYASNPTLGGLTLDQTLNYVLLAQVFAPLAQTHVIFDLGYGIREGMIGIELLRPVDFQGRHYVANLAELVLALILRIPLLVIAVLVFGVTLPGDPLVWLAFLVSVVLGNAVIFFFDWILACMAFYTTEVWGWSVLRYGIGLFFSGALIPLAIMPPTLQAITLALPFAQALYMPVSILSGLTPLSEVPQVWLGQLLWTIGLFAASRLVFRFAVRAVTVQGG